MLTTKDYIKKILKTKLPALDISDGSPLSELFVNPTAAIFDPVLTQLKYLLDNLGLLEPEKINPAELDTIAANFLITRRAEVPSTGYVEMYFDTAQNMLIPAGTAFTATDGRIYTTTTAFLVAESTMQANLWKFPLFSTGLIPVSAISDSIGTPLSPGTIISTDFEPTPIQVTNPTAFSEGIVAETNTELVNRLINAVVNRSLASEQSYKNLIAENFPSVLETIVIGAGDERMSRDLHYSGIESLESYYVTDYFGKISVNDFYISASGGYYIKTSGLFDEVPQFNEYPYPQSRAWWTLFYDDPATSGILVDLPTPDEYTMEFTTSQYANLYYLKDQLKTSLHTALLLYDPFVGGAFDDQWLAGDVNSGATVLKNAYELASTPDGARFGFTPGSLPELPVNVSKKFLRLVQQMFDLSLKLNPSFAQYIDMEGISAELLAMYGITKHMKLIITDN
jgi:hypothetical protein